MPCSPFSSLFSSSRGVEKLSISKQKLGLDGSSSPFPAESSSQKEASSLFPGRRNVVLTTSSPTLSPTGIPLNKIALNPILAKELHLLAVTGGNPSLPQIRRLSWESTVVELFTFSPSSPGTTKLGKIVQLQLLLH